MTVRPRVVLVTALTAALVAAVALGAHAAAPRQLPLPTPAPPPAPAAAVTLDAQDTEPGWIALTIGGGVPGDDVTITEVVDGVAQPIHDVRQGSAPTTIHHAATWLCSRHARTFVATETHADGSTDTATATITTPSCRSGLALVTWPQPARIRRPLDVTITSTRKDDRRPVRVCATRRSQRVCHATTLSAVTGSADAALVLHHTGAWRLTVTGPGIALSRHVSVGRRPLTILATGDSEIQVFDDLLASALHGQAHVVGEAHISTGLSKLGMFNWLARARTQAATIHPDITIMAIGANDGFDLPSPTTGAPVACCGAAWVTAYAQRAHEMMGSYVRRGAGRVYWFLLPTPRKTSFVPFFAAIDQGFEQAAAKFTRDVHVVDIRPIFSPGGVYRQFVDGVDARESDGIHLSAAGDRIALRFLLSEMRKDHTL